MRIKSEKDFWSGVMFTVVGAGFAWTAYSNYTVGVGARMGPGYFPLMLGVVLALLGLATLFKALNAGPPDGQKIGPWAWRPLAYIIGANLLFGVLLGGLPSIGLPPMGMIVAIYGLTIVASLAGESFKLKEVLVLATLLSLLSYGAFVMLLRLQFPVWPTFITG